jgi:oligosaccharide repeat unit polymerase
MLLIILLTILFTWLILGAVTFLVYLRYQPSPVNFWLFHPLIIFNALVILTFFIPYLFQLSFGSVVRNLDLNTVQNVKDLVIISLIFCFVNLFVYLIDRLVVRKKFRDLKLLVKNKEIVFFFFLFVLVLFFHFLSFFQGSYYHGPLNLKNVEFRQYSGLMNFMLGPVRNLAWLGLIFLYFTRFSENKTYKILFWFLMILNVFFGFPSGSKALILIPFLLFVFCYLVFNKRNFWKTVLSIALLLVLFFPSYNVWRSFRYHGSPGGYLTFLSQKEGVRGKGYMFYIVNGFIQRLDTFSIYFILSDSYPEKYDFLNGKSYLPIFFSPFPRSIFSSKPGSVNINEIGRKVGFIAKHDYGTTPGISWWGEAYLNFGYLGVYLVLLFILLFYQILFLVWLRFRSNLIVTSTYVTFLFYIPFTAHAGIGGLFGDFLKFLFVGLLVGLVTYIFSSLKKHE